jgi:HNH endonuclease
MKTCSKCNQEKPFSEFYKRPRYKDGHLGVCKKCKYENDRKWLKSNPENQTKANQARRDWYKKNGGEYHKQWRDENRERINKMRQEIRRGEREPSKDAFWKGKKRPELKGENNPNWQGGTTSERKRAMSTVEYRQWRFCVLKRDNFKCVMCNNENPLQVHHIVPWSENVILRFSVENGVSLCRGCHNKIKDKESQFQSQFTEYVASQGTIELSVEELEKFSSLIHECDNCHEELLIPNWQKVYKYHFCDNECKNNYQKINGGFAKGNRRSELIDIPCSQCGTILQRTQYRLSRSLNHFCGRECKRLFTTIK